MSEGLALTSERHTHPSGFKNWIRGWLLVLFPGKLTSSNLVTFDELALSPNKEQD